MLSNRQDTTQRTFSAQDSLEKTNDIFILEDDQIDQRLISQSFAKHITSIPINLVFFNTGEQLLSYLNQHKVLPSVLICDINLPGITGLEAIDQMVVLDLNDKRPFIVVLSGSDPTLDTQFKLTSNISGYYQKPASKRDWDRIIDEICHLSLKNKKSVNGSMP